MAKHDRIIYKIPDLGLQNPFDSLMLVKVPAYVVILFVRRRTFVIIDIDKWLSAKGTDKSISYEKCCEIGKAVELPKTRR